MKVIAFYIVFLSFISVSSLWAVEKKTIYFTPLPIENERRTVEEFLPLIDYIQHNLPFDIKLHTKQDYNDILLGFKDGSIDIAYLGPLPYAILKAQYPHIRPIVSFKQEDGSMSYKCVLSKFIKDEIDFTKPLNVALTQPLSTCGYFMTQKLLKEKFGISLKNQNFAYTMSHTNALTGVLAGKYMLAGTNEDIAHKYESLGMEIIAMSEDLPVLSLVVNTKTLSATEIEAIRETLQNIPQSSYKEWDEIMKYGFAPSDEKAYNALKIKGTSPEKGNMQ